MAEKAHLTKFRKFSTKFHSLPFNIESLYTRVTPQLVKNITVGDFFQLFQSNLSGCKYMVKLIDYLNIYIKDKKKRKT